MEEASKVYTRKMFKIFQEELVRSQIFAEKKKLKDSSEVLINKVH